ncbi:30S ribosomal protein S19e [Haloglomus salinum]|jgi:small subunit ribosomal protein S19e|uniref:30S ribosomal protein S19e n=1 Tax=Haloglomus salinum TaxID=2962673 RepID=UPI0020C9A583|nr:30S ribosomal protein S19e [Haloglomus salinum]
MATLYDVPTEEFIEALAERLTEDDTFDEPDWAAVAKTGVGRELPPEQDDFWQRRAASVFRKVAVDGPVGVQRLRTSYGDSKQGSTRYRVRPDQKTESSGKIVRTILQQLEDADYVQQEGSAGRAVTGDGRAFLSDVATDLLEDLDRPELERYA